MAPTRPRGRPRKSQSSTTTSSSARTSDPLGSFPVPPTVAPSFVDSAYGSQSQSQAHSQPHDISHIHDKPVHPSERVPLMPHDPVEARTPIHKAASSPHQIGARMTAAQKQALVDNLRLEITDRARRLRAQYAQSAASLRRRLEMRIHRVPAALRKLTLGEVIARHERKLKDEAEAKAQRAKEAAEREQEAKQRAETVAAAAPKRPVKGGRAVTTTRAQKRASDELDAAGQENLCALPNKRARPNTTLRSTVAKPSSTTARRVDPSASTHLRPREVLSPKSHNSRTFPAPSFKPPVKPASTRPTSPLKPSAMVSPSKPVTIPANVPTVASVGTASSMAKTKATGKAAPAKPATANAASRAGATRTQTRARAGVAKGGTSTNVLADAELQREGLKQGRTSGETEGSVGSSGTVVRKGTGTGRKKVVKKTAVTSQPAIGDSASVRGGRTLRKRP